MEIMTDRSTIQQTDMMGHGEVTLPVQCVHPNTYIRYLFLHSPEKKTFAKCERKVLLSCFVISSTKYSCRQKHKHKTRHLRGKISYWKCNLTMNTPLRLMVGWSFQWSFPKLVWRVQFHCSFFIWSNYSNMAFLNCLMIWATGDFS